MENKPKILITDIETSPIIAYCWGLFDQNIGLDQIVQDWFIISFAAKWLDEKEVVQHDLRKGINNRNEKAMLKHIWKLLDQADIVVGQNSKKFDIKKLNEKFLQHGLGEPSPYRQIDTLVESKKYFAPTSHKLEFRSKVLNKKHKKSAHSKFPGMSLWKECLAGNQEAWKEMGEYNCVDVISTEEYFKILRPWIKGINFDVFHGAFHNVCKCGSKRFQKRGFNFTNTGRFQRFQCQECGSWSQDKNNLLAKEKRQTFRK